VEPVLAKITQIEPVTYDWNSDGKKGYGFIAQDVYRIFPDLRPCLPNAYVPDPVIDEPVQEDGTPEYYQLDYASFTPFTTKAIQELVAKVEQLEERRDELTRLVDELKTHESAV
jgi:hypothetical protein